jgi:hypothetical protein
MANSVFLVHFAALMPQILFFLPLQSRIGQEEAEAFSFLQTVPALKANCLELLR